MTRAFLAGLAILVIGDTAYFAALTLPEAPSEVAMVIWVVPVVAAFVTSWLAPKRKFYAGLVVVVPAALDLRTQVNRLQQLHRNTFRFWQYLFAVQPTLLCV